MLQKRQKTTSLALSALSVLACVLYFSFRQISPAASAAAISAAPQNYVVQRPVWSIPEQTIQVSVQPGDRLVVSSLDLFARSHQVRLNYAEGDDSPGDADVVRTTLQPQPSTRRTFEPSSRPIDELPTRLNLPPERRRFSVPFFTEDGHVEVPTAAVRVAFNRRIVVFADLPDMPTQLVNRTAAAVLKCVDDGVLQFVETRVGPIADIDADERLTIVLTSLCSNESRRQQSTPIHGCVKSQDFLLAARQPEFSGDIVYLSANLPEGEELRALLAHEFTHAAVFSAMAEQQHSFSRMPNWLNEAIAHCVEREVFPASDNLSQRMRDFTRSPGRASVVIPDFQSTRVSRGPARAAGCLFLESLLNGDDGMQLRRLVRHRDSGAAALQDVFEQPFEELFRSWTVQRASHGKRPELKPATAHNLNGTASIAFDVPHQGLVTLSAAVECRLQVTVVAGDLKQAKR